MKCDPELSRIANRAECDGGPSPFLSSSPNDMAHQAGLWARRHNLLALEIKKLRGYKLLLNRRYVLDFKRDSQNPDLVEECK